MGVVSFSAEQYAAVLRQLLPPGRFDWEAGTVLRNLLLACGDELARVSGRVLDLIEESHVQTASELLDDLDRVYFGAVQTGTDEERRDKLQAQATRRQRNRPADFQDVLASVLDLAPNQVVVLEQDRAHAILVNDDKEIFRFYIYRNPLLPGTYSVDTAQEILDGMSPSHTVGHIIESQDMKCDEATSLCDRDRLGA